MSNEQEIFEGKDNAWIERFKEKLYYILAVAEEELQRRKAELRKVAE